MITSKLGFYHWRGRPYVSMDVGKDSASWPFEICTSASLMASLDHRIRCFHPGARTLIFPSVITTT